jgi:hypothetical protein
MTTVVILLGVLVFLAICNFFDHRSARNMAHLDRETAKRRHAELLAANGKLKQ